MAQSRPGSSSVDAVDSTSEKLAPAEGECDQRKTGQAPSHAGHESSRHHEGNRAMDRKKPLWGVFLHARSPETEGEVEDKNRKG